MDEMEQAHHELNRLQEVITRHERHIFALRGWLLAIVGGLLAAYYSQNIEMDEIVVQIALVLIVLLYLFIDTRHINLIEAVVKRSLDLETLIRDSRPSTGEPQAGWYDGPKLSMTCEKGAERRWPKRGMTYLMNQPFYLVVIAVVLLATLSLPPK